MLDVAGILEEADDEQEEYDPNITTPLLATSPATTSHASPHHSQPFADPAKLHSAMDTSWTSVVEGSQSIQQERQQFWALVKVREPWIIAGHQ